MMYFILFIVVGAALTIFYSFNNKMQNRRADRHNRLIERQDELLEMLRNKSALDNQEKKETTNEN